MDNGWINCFLMILTLTIFVCPTEVEYCGGHLTSPKGIIQTPNFPGAFSVPIKCHWVIDATDIIFGNSSIVIYLTQLYVFKGLKFTEYAYYESESTNFGAAIIKEVTEGNIFEYRWFKTYRPFLVIEFKLERLEGNHVRVLHDLLDVYGFNVTYEVTEVDTNPNSCTVRDCSYSGNCILDGTYSSFSCQCFEGFHGDKCSHGPLCMDDNRNAICKNGGTCRHIGAEAVKCHCPEGYTGNSCEIPLLSDHHDDCPDDTCILQCPFITKHRKPCDCQDPIRVYNNRARYECRIKLANSTVTRNSTSIQSASTETLLRKQLTKYLRNSNVSTVEDLKILSVTPSSEVTFHFFGASEDGDRIREALNRLIQRRRLNEFNLESTHFTFQQKPSLRIQSLRINQVNEHEVRLGDQFILSCVVQGSSDIKFVWYKDDMLVNMSKSTREIWYKDLPNDGSDIHTSLLTIDKTTLLDAGEYSCQAIDWGMQQCKSIYIDVRDEPEVKVLPMSSTIDKGNDVQLLCITPNMRSLGIGFGWTKNRALLKLEPGSQVWEDLYPAGSILKIMNAQKSAIYTCNVAHRSMSVRVEVVNRTAIPICSMENAWGMQWPDTAPNSEALLDCPRQFVGARVSRFCSMRDATTSVWQLPDFSECLYQPFIAPYTKFRSLTLGYVNTTGSETIIALWEVLRSRKLPLYPGEGDRLLSIFSEIEEYQNFINDLDDLYNSAETLIRAMNRIITDEHSIIKNEKQLLLQQLTQRNLEYWTRLLIYPYKHLALSSIVVDIQALHATEDDWSEHILQIPVDDYVYPPWYSDRVRIRLLRADVDDNINKTFSGIVIVYKNITKFLPNTYVKELEDGTDLEYRFYSRVVTVSLSPSLDTKSHSKIHIELRMRNVINRTGSWNVSCGIENTSGSWDLDSCKAKLINEESSIQCLCTKPGTFAVFLTSRATRISLANEQVTFTVLLGCELCLLECSVTCFILIFNLWINRSWLNFLKLQCATALLGAMAVFIYAVQSTLSENLYSTIAVTLEAFFLIGMSSPISQALIIYADLTQVHPSRNFQPTVIAVITGLPIICISTTELTHKSTGLRHESWWLIFGSGVYNIFVSCVATMLSIFILLYSGILWKAHALVDQRSVKRETIDPRIGLIHRAALIVCGLIAMEAASIFYINSTSVVYHYVFAVVSTILGFIVLFSYCGSREILLLARFLRKFKFKDETETADPIKVSPKIIDLDNETVLPTVTILNGPKIGETRDKASGTIDMRDYVNETSISCSKSSKKSLRYHETRSIERSENIDLENYSTSPRKYNELKKYDNYPSDFHELNNKINLKNDKKLVKSREIQTTMTIEPINNESTKVLCSADIESRINLNSMPDVTLATKNDTENFNNIELIKRDNINIIPDIASTGEQKQSISDNKNPKITVTDCENTTTGMLDRISHDLDYLLNRNNEEL